MRRHALVLALIAATSACATGTISTTRQPAPASTSATNAQAVPGGIRWFAAAAEQRAAYLQTYRFATSTIERLAKGHSAGGWAVILDADETVIDNSPYEVQQARLGVPYDSVTWDAWVKRGAARALPGAVEFTSRVHALGGRVVIVTNRDQSTARSPARTSFASACRRTTCSVHRPHERQQGSALRCRAERHGAVGAAAAGRVDVGGRQHPGLPATQPGDPQRTR